MMVVTVSSDCLGGARAGAWGSWATLWQKSGPGGCRPASDSPRGRPALTELDAVSLVVTAAAPSESLGGALAGRWESEVRLGLGMDPGMRCAGSLPGGTRGWFALIEPDVVPLVVTAAVPSELLGGARAGMWGSGV